MYGAIRIASLMLMMHISVDAARIDDSNRIQVGASSWQGAWTIVPSRRNTWSMHTRIPMTASNAISEIAPHNTNLLDNTERVSLDTEDLVDEFEGRGKHKFKKYKKYLLPLLLAYKLKFFTLIPILIGGLVLLTGATGLAGFFFALFAATMGLKGGGDH